MVRPTRTHVQLSLYTDDDSENDNENSDYETTPKVTKKTKGKKRVSDAFHAGGEGSSPHRVPFMAVNINDDEAEKRRRRKSAKVAQPMLSMTEVEMEDSQNINDTPRASRHLKHKQQLMAVAEAPVINVPLDVMSSNFEEWMKMATDNVYMPYLLSSLPFTENDMTRKSTQQIRGILL